MDENRCDADTRDEYMAKLDRVKTMTRLRTLSSNCACCSICRASVWMRHLGLDVRSGAYPLHRRPGDTWSERLAGHCFFTALELFGRLEIHMTETGAQTTVDSVMALGYAMSKNYATLAPKVECRAARYSVQVAAGGDE